MRFSKPLVAEFVNFLNASPMLSSRSGAFAAKLELPMPTVVISTITRNRSCAVPKARDPRCKSAPRRRANRQ